MNPTGMLPCKELLSPSTKLWEGNVFTGLYLSMGWRMFGLRASLVPGPFLVPGPVSFQGE